LKTKNENEVSHVHDNRQQAVVDGELGKRSLKHTQKRILVAVEDIARDIESCGKPAHAKTYYKETPKVYSIEVFRVKKKVRDAENSSEVTCKHCHQAHPKE
tara:strand:- start:16828 stop:17130 length:303 start_codon:yes stop_codon:yes gene_type:complete